MTELEHEALKLCAGEVLDVGAAAGSHALELQERGIGVMALDNSPIACEVMRKRGVIQVIQADFFQYKARQFDTLLLLMNGIGLCGTINGLQDMLQHFKLLLKPGGKVIFDSSDIAYLYEGKIPETRNYYGELEFRYAYRKQFSDPFFWLYVDKNTMTRIATDAGFRCKIVLEDERDQYLAVLELLS
jgi:SAM-dependent methyltransferase